MKSSTTTQPPNVDVPISWISCCDVNTNHDGKQHIYVGSIYIRHNVLFWMKALYLGFKKILENSWVADENNSWTAPTSRVVEDHWWFIDVISWFIGDEVCTCDRVECKRDRRLIILTNSWLRRRTITNDRFWKWVTVKDTFISSQWDWKEEIRQSILLGEFD